MRVWSSHSVLDRYGAADSAVAPCVPLLRKRSQLWRRFGHHAPCRLQFRLHRQRDALKTTGEPWKGRAVRDNGKVAPDWRKTINERRNNVRKEGPQSWGSQRVSFPPCVHIPPVLSRDQSWAWHRHPITWVGGNGRRLMTG